MATGRSALIWQRRSHLFDGQACLAAHENLFLQEHAEFDRFTNCGSVLISPSRRNHL
jgi:hypothetical protein